MKTVSIRYLHARTDAIVRAAARQPVQVTDRGRVVAVIQAPSIVVLAAPLPDRKAWIARLPRQKSDSADAISHGRDR